MGKRAEAKARQKAWKIYEAQIKPALEKASALHHPHIIDPIHAAQVQKVRLKFQARLVRPELKKEANATLYNDTSAKVWSD